MITFVRTISIAPGKTPECLAFARNIAKLAEDKFGLDIRLDMPIGGNPNRVAFVSEYANLSEYESTIVKFTSDADYLKLVAGNAANVIPGSVFDEIWRSV